MSIVVNFLEIIERWITGFINLIVSSIQQLTVIFYDSTENQFTIIGMLALMGLAIGLVRYCIRFVTRFFIK